MGVGEGCQGVAIDDKALLLVSSVVCSPRAMCVCCLVSEDQAGSSTQRS